MANTDLNIYFNIFLILELCAWSLIFSNPWSQDI